MGDFIKNECFTLLEKVSDLTTQSYHLTRTLFCPWDPSGRNTGVDTRSLLQGIFPMLGSNSGPLHRRQILYHMSHWGAVSLNSEWASELIRRLLKQIWALHCLRFDLVRHLWDLSICTSIGFQDWGCCARDHVLKAVSQVKESCSLLRRGAFSPVSITPPFLIVTPASTPTLNMSSHITHLLQGHLTLWPMGRAHSKYSGKGVSLFLATTSCTWSPWVWDRPPWSWHCYSLLCSCQIQMSSKTQTRSCRSIWLFWPCRDPCMEIAGRSQVTGLQRWEDLGERRRWSSLFGLPDEQLKPQVCLQYRW